MIDVNWDLAPEGAEELVQFESHVTWRKGIKIWCMVKEGWRDYVSDFKTIATRPTQTKTVADAVEQESEKWTHTYDGQKVRWLGDKPDSCEEMAIQYQSGEYGLARVSTLKPIKPTISEVEAWRLVSERDMTPDEGKEKCEVV